MEAGLTDTRYFVVGSAPNCDVVLEETDIARHHCKIKKVDEGFLVEDLGSAAGTFVNGKRIEQPTFLCDADTLLLGEFAFDLKTLDIKTPPEKSVKANSIIIEVQDLAIQSKGKCSLEKAAFSVFPGELVGVISTTELQSSELLDTLMGKRLPAAGSVKFNQEDVYESQVNLKTCVAFLPQKDVFHGVLTVGQVVEYAAHIRLPANLSDQDRQDCVGKVLGKVGLEDARDQKIDSWKGEVVQGVQRKCVSLAVELLADPSILFAEDPFVDLNFPDRLAILKVFQQLTSEGKTVVLSIRDLEADLWQAFDQLIVLSESLDASSAGRLVYFGPVSDVLNFFFPSGHQEPVKTSEIITALGKESPDDLCERYENSSSYRQFVTARRGQTSRQDQNVLVADRPSPGRQLATLLRRGLQVKRYDYWTTGILLGQSLILGIFIVWMFGKPLAGTVTATTWLEVAEAVAGVSFAVSVASFWVGSLNATLEITREWVTYFQERTANLGLFVFVLAKFVVLGAFTFLQCFVLMVLVYWGCGLQSPFWILIGLSALTAGIGLGIGFAISAFARSLVVAMGTLFVLVVISLCFSGFFIPIDEMSRPVRVLSQGTPMRWSFEAMLFLEAERRDAEPMEIPGTARMNRLERQAIPARNMAEIVYFPATHRIGLRTSTWILAIMFLAGVVAVYWVLRFRDNY